MTGQEFKRWLQDFDVSTSRPLVMGIVNLTPDSFWDGSRYLAVSDVLKKVEQMILEGVDLIDIGAESTRPGSARIDEKTEFERLIPVLDIIKKQFDICISVDTYKPQIMRASLDIGADMINDVCALSSDESIELIRSFNVPVCLMHISGSLNSIGTSVENHEHILENILLFFLKKLAELKDKGLELKNLILDPGIGFGKSTEANLKIIRGLETFVGLNCPLLIGASRKKFIGNILNKPVEDRLLGSITAHLMSFINGCRIIRTHDVMATQDCLTMAQAILDR